MADLCCEYQFGDLILNDEEADDRLVIGENGIQGLDGAPIRSQIDPRGQADGGIVHTKRFGPRRITFSGPVDIRSVENRQTDAYRSALMDLQLFVIAELESFLNDETDLIWTPSGGTPTFLTCTYGFEGGEIVFSGPMHDCEWTFGLVSEDSDIWITT